MSEGFFVDGAAVEKHVAKMAELATDVRTAAGIAQPLRRDAYGLIGQLFAARIDETARAASQAVADIAEVVHRSGEGVQVGYESYRTIDRTIARLFETMSELLEASR
jgi:hypothetical protein